MRKIRQKNVPAIAGFLSIPMPEGRGFSESLGKLLGLFPILLAWRERRINKIAVERFDPYSLEAALIADCDEAKEYL